MSADPKPSPPSPFFPEVTSLVGKVVLGRYRVVRPIGRGGMGIVYLARNEGAAGFVKPVVIKQTLPHLSDSNAMISAREARIMSNLRHPGIVDVLDFAEEDGSYLLVLDYVHGYNMAQWNRFLRQSSRLLSWQIVCHVLANVLDALHYAHTLKGPNGEKLEVVHRDVSPSNVLVDISGHVKLADFGVARMQTEQTAEGSQEKGLKGKMSYLAPELLQLEPPTPLSDVYACGVVLHELLIGKNEMRGDGLAGTSLRALFHDLSPPSGSRTDIPQELDAVVAKAVAKDKALRYPTAQAFAHALRGLQKMSEGELTALLATNAASDFADPRMAGQGSSDLSTLDRAWREAPSTGSVERVKAPSLDDTAAKNRERESITVAALEEKSGPRRQEPKSWIGLAVSVGAAMVAAAATAFFVVRRPQAPPGPEPILLVQTPVPVDSSPNGAGVIDTFAPTDSHAKGALSEGPAPSSTLAPRPRTASSGAASTARQSPADAISRTFAQKKALVAKCFTDHPTESNGAPMAVHFQIDEKGTVLSAKLLPAELGGTPLASCIEGVARSTVFGPQHEPISFRVPITARRVP